MTTTTASRHNPPMPTWSITDCQLGPQHSHRCNTAHRLQLLEKLSSIEDRGHTDRVTALPLTYALDYDFWPWLSIQGELWSDPHVHLQKLKFKDQSVQKIKWKQTNGETDRRMLPIASPSRLTRSVDITAHVPTVRHGTGIKQLAQRKQRPYHGIMSVWLSIKKG